MSQNHIFINVKCLAGYVPHQYSACLECARLLVLSTAKKEKGEEGGKEEVKEKHVK